MKEKRLAGAALYHIIIFAIGIIMVYPLIWMVMSSFKETNTIFTTASSLIPEHFVTDNYANGWKGFAKISFSTFFKNSIFRDRYHWNHCFLCCCSLRFRKI